MRKSLLCLLSLLPFYAFASTITGIKADGDTKVFNLDEVTNIKVENGSALAVHTRSGDVKGGYSKIEFSGDDNKLFDSKSNYEIKVYPNPVKSILYLVGADAETKFEIVSTIGKVVMNGTGESVNVSNLAKGQYVIKVDNKSVKFIKE
ncbi:MAG: T9SS type A sorting domain-containing protein [Bacilli bacterium]|nr:T9SS type A sorting domain-containing protein [Bacilli bacterium]